MPAPVLHSIGHARHFLQETCQKCTPASEGLEWNATMSGRTCEGVVGGEGVVGSEGVGARLGRGDADVGGGHQAPAPGLRAAHDPPVRLVVYRHLRIAFQLEIRPYVKGKRMTQTGQASGVLQLAAKLPFLNSLRSMYCSSLASIGCC